MSPTTLPKHSPSPASSLTAQVLPPNSKALPAKKPRRRRRLIFVIVTLAVLSAIGLTIRWWALPAEASSVEITATVTRGDLPVVVTERGELESSTTITSKCEVEVDQIKIVAITAEGTRVKKGDIVVQFDTDKLKRSVAEQEVKYNTAAGKYETAVQELELQKNKAETESAKAQLALTLAELDLEKYVKGEYLADLDEKKGLIKLAEKELQDAEEKLRYYQTFVKKGFGTPEQLRLKELEVEKARNYLERDKAKLVVLEKYTKKRQEAELQFKADDAKRELVRTKNSGAASIAKANADLAAARVVANLEKEQLERYKKQLEFAVVKAPADGILVYSQSRWWDPQSRIQVGAMAMFQQPLFQLPELDHMQVKVRVHESKVKRIQIGQKAEVRVEAFPNRVLHGTVRSVATLSDSANSWRRGGVKEYETVIVIEDLPGDAALKPGMTAEVAIKVNQLSDVLLIPVQAVTEIAGKHFVYRPQRGSIDRCEVTIGESNDKYVQITSGLDAGEALCLDARARGAAETKDHPMPESAAAAATPATGK